MSQSTSHPRRKFVARLAGAVAALTAGLPSVARATGLAPPDSDESEHDAWMTPLKGKHRQFFHETAVGDRSMLMASNYLDTYAEAFGARPGEANAVIGIHGPGLSMGFTDVAWVKYGFGKSFNVTDPATKQQAVRNLFATGGGLAIDTLQKRGVVVLMCNQALRRLSRSLAAERGEAYETVYEDLKASRLPGTILVPAMVVAINRAQEKGFSYVKV